MTATVLNTNIAELENKIPDIDNLVTTTVFNTKIGEFENKTPDAVGLVKKKKRDYNPKVSAIEAKYFTTSDYKFLSKIL